MLPIPFANPATYAGHSGIDYPGHTGAPILASAPGRVSHLGSNARGGHYIWVKYDAIAPLVGYHHMNSFNGCPPAGARLQEGSRLGYVGWDGHVVPAGPGGAHLHSEVAGYATTSGYWKFFDRNRVVGQGSGGGTNPGQEDDDMGMTDEEWRQFQVMAGTVNDTHAMAKATRDAVANINAWVSEGGVGVTAGIAADGTIASRVINLDRQVTGANGTTVNLVQHVLDLKDRPAATVSDAQIAAIARAVAEQIGTPSVSVDYAKIAADVRAKFATEPLK